MLVKPLVIDCPIVHKRDDRAAAKGADARVPLYAGHIAAGRRLYRHRDVRFHCKGRCLCTVPADFLLRGKGKPRIVRQLSAHQADQSRTARAVVDGLCRNGVRAELLPVPFKIGAVAKAYERERFRAALRADVDQKLIRVGGLVALLRA